MRLILVLAFAATPSGVATNALAIAPIEESELNQGIVKGCLYQSGEFGLEVVRSCIETETVAAKAVLALPAEHDEVVLRCMQDFRISGWSMVKNCVEQALDSGTGQSED